MSNEAYIVIALVVAAVAIFATNKLPIDLTAFGILVVLLLTGILTPQEGLSGLSNPATVTVAAMFVLSFAISKTGLVELMARILRKLAGRSYSLGSLFLMVVSGTASAFINNTATVAVLMPVTIRFAGLLNIGASRLLMPLSYAAILGGTCTLIGTSTNLLVNSIARSQGQPGFSMFEFLPLGGIMFIVGIIYIMTIGRRLIPDRGKGEGLFDRYESARFLTEIQLEESSRSVGLSIDSSPLVSESKIEILSIIRGSHVMYRPSRSEVLLAGDILRIVCDVEKLSAIFDQEGIRLTSHPSDQTNASADDTEWIEVVVAPNASIIGRSPYQIDFMARANIEVLARRFHGQPDWKNVRHNPLNGGDALLLRIPKDQQARLRRNPDFVITTAVRRKLLPPWRAWLCLPIMVAVVGPAAVGWLPIEVSALMGVVAMIGLKLLTPSEAYRSIEWSVIFMLAGLLPLGVALEKTGAAKHLADLLISFGGAWGPLMLLSALYLVTSIMTEVLSNNATAVLLTPIAISMATSLNVSPMPFLVATTFAASASFMTPIGYQTNMLIYEPGQFRFSDYIKVGVPLNLISWILATIFIPVFWPF